MLVSIDTLKEYLGLPEGEDAVKDPLLEKSSQIAQTLVSAYLGFTVELDTSVKLRYYTAPGMSNQRLFRLREFPVVVHSVKMDGATVSSSMYVTDQALGLVEFLSPVSFSNRLEVEYSAGFNPEACPADILEAITNIALTLYASGGKLPEQSVSANPLKSLTMFDAMSMSFDTAGVTSGAVESMVSQWAFVLDQYSVKKFVVR